MLLWITIALLAVGIYMVAIGTDNQADVTIFAGLTITAISLIATLSMLTVIIFLNLSKEAKIEELREQYKAIMYKEENCRDDYGLQDKEIVDDIEQWNTKIKRYKSLRSNVWIGIFFPDIYDEFDTIEYEIMKKTG
jgi:hypothetical protein